MMLLGAAGGARLDVVVVGEEDFAAVVEAEERSEVAVVEAVHSEDAAAPDMASEASVGRDANSEAPGAVDATLIVVGAMVSMDADGNVDVTGGVGSGTGMGAFGSRGPV